MFQQLYIHTYIHTCVTCIESLINVPLVPKTNEPTVPRHHRVGRRLCHAIDAACMYVCLYVSLCASAYIYIYIYIYIHTSIYTYGYDMHAYVYICMYVHIYNTHTHIHAHIHTYIHTYIHTHIHVPSKKGPLVGRTMGEAQ